MSQQACRIALETEPSHLRSEEVSKCGGGGVICESYIASDHSPGIVDNEELLCLLVKDPQHILDDNRLNPTVFAGIFTRGVSVVRDDADDGQLLITAQMILEETAVDKRYLHGVCIFRSAIVRFLEGERFLTVFDTGYEDRPHHADLFQPNPTQLGSNAKKRQQRVIRDQIGECLSPILDFRSGLLAAYKKPGEN